MELIHINNDNGYIENINFLTNGMSKRKETDKYNFIIVKSDDMRKVEMTAILEGGRGIKRIVAFMDIPAGVYGITKQTKRAIVIKKIEASTPTDEQIEELLNIDVNHSFALINPTVDILVYNIIKRTESPVSIQNVIDCMPMKGTIEILISNNKVKIIHENLSTALFMQRGY